MMERNSFTTADQLAYLRNLERRHRIDILRAELRILDKRSWVGPGMNVDVEAVRDALIAMIARGEAPAATNGRGGRRR